MAGDKLFALLNFLKTTATLRQKRFSAYGPEDKILWLADIPKECDDCRSPLLTKKPDDFGEIWLEVRKKQMPVRPPVPQVAADWVRAYELDEPENHPGLLPEITVLVERKVPDSSAPLGTQRTIFARVPEQRRLVDHPEVQEAWLEYVNKKWEPWAREVHRWREVQKVYETLDFMRRRLEEAEERYELVLAIGFLQ